MSDSIATLPTEAKPLPTPLPGSLTEICNFSRSALISELETELGVKPFRARQLLRWIYKSRKTDFSEMTDIAKSIRRELDQRYSIMRLPTINTQDSIDGTRKYLFELPDGKFIESVLIKQETRNTLCISSQVGCAIACSFCRTGRMGLTRNLTTAEIVGQVLSVQDDIASRNIVFMGMGEPFHNINNVIPAVELLNDPLGFDFSSRKITVSTSGLVPSIEKFGASNAEANLAISLNATTDEVRDVLIPINKKWPLKVLLQALKDYPLKKGRRITIEYVMLKDVNDTKADLDRLPKLLQGIPAKINLIPYNDNSGLGYDAPLHDNVYHWQRSLLNRGMNSSIRWSKGLDIDAACGQLATKSIREKKIREAK
ncbi:UNVERIFIED_CONTAM: hypothetical protein GTU68_032470 [Idotea baltica]|nr:hypothetical protein [Idotea baltica]